jgi:hypothetical protein
MCVEAADEIERLRVERDMWRQENLKKQIACEQMGARIVALEAEVEKLRKTVIAARSGGVEAAAAVASKRAASRHSTVEHCHSDRSKKHMQIRADEAGQLVADIRALLEAERDVARREGIEAAALAAANYQLNNDGCVAAIRALLEDK